MKKSRKLSCMLLAGLLSCAAVMGFASTAVQAANVNKEGAKAAKASLNLEEGAQYHAYILFSVQNSWVFRNKFFEKENGITYKHWNNLVTSLDLDEPKPVDGKIEDTVIAGNGHYTVKLTDLNGSPSAGATNAEFGILGFSTDIPDNDTIKFDNVKVKIDGIDKGGHSGEDVYYDKDDIQNPGLITVEVLNAWHEECKSLPLTLPSDSVEISFDVSGFHFDNPDASGEKLESENQESISTDDKKSDDTQKDNSFPVVPVATIVAVIIIAIVVCAVIKKSKK